MAEITAAAVKSLRERTGLPMMDCKKALTECNGDTETAIDWLRKQGLKTMEKRAGRETAFGRMGLFADMQTPKGAMVELKCESAPVAGSDEFITLANDLAKQLATGPGAATAEELLDQPSPSKPGMTLREVKDDMFNRIREVFNIGRMQRYDGTCGGYSHNAGTVSGVLLQVEGSDADAAKDICMHVAAMRPQALTVAELDPAIVARERDVLTEAARAEGKPENIIEKMVEGRMRNFYAESVLLEQPFVKDDKQTVGAYAKSKGLNIVSFTHWELMG
ncbi:MAG: translation elongation factor Ts [Planctomycetales bacterium]|nr:translation elongation factor Ts [Planctomycetales bacterium]